MSPTTASLLTTDPFIASGNAPTSGPGAAVAPWGPTDELYGICSACFQAFRLYTIRNTTPEDQSKRRIWRHKRQHPGAKTTPVRLCPGAERSGLNGRRFLTPAAARVYARSILALEQTERIAIAVFEAWRDGMLDDHRRVPDDRLNWSDLDPVDQALDRYIARRLIWTLAPILLGEDVGL